MCLLGQRLELGLRNRFFDDIELDGETEPAGGARADRDGAGDLRALRILFLLAGNIVERPAEAGRVAAGKQVLGSRRAGLTRTTHFLGNRQIYTHRTIVGFGMTIASANSRGPRGEQRFDFHRQYLFADQIVRDERVRRAEMGTQASAWPQVSPGWNHYAIRSRDGPRGWSCSIGGH